MLSFVTKVTVMEGFRAFYTDPCRRDFKRHWGSLNYAEVFSIPVTVLTAAFSNAMTNECERGKSAI